MPDGIFLDNCISQLARIFFRGEETFNPNKFYLCLAKANTYTRASSALDFISNEILEIDGYNRVRVIFGEDGFYSVANKRHQMPTITASFISDPDGASLQFQTGFLLANGHQVANKLFNNTQVDVSNDRINISNHGFSDGDRLTFTAEDNSALPTGITPGSIYQVINATANDFRITNVNGGAVNITNVGAGSFRARSTGFVLAYGIEPNPITILPGQGYTYQLSIAVLNSGFTVGV